MALVKRIKSFFLVNNSTIKIPAISESQNGIFLNNSMTILPWSEGNASLFYQLEDKYYQYFIGVNSLLDLDLNSFEVDVIDSLDNTIQHQQSLAEEIPRLPDIIPKLIHLLRTDDFTWKDVAKLIAQDPVILVGVIKVANSSLYNLQAKDEQLEHMLVQLGLSEVRKIIMKVALKPIMLFDGGHFLRHSGTKIWIHSVKSAEACHSLARSYKQEPFDAYLAGLLHNLGMTIVVQKMNSVRELDHAPRSIKFKEEILNFSKQLSAKIADDWEMSPAVVVALNEQMQFDTGKIKSSLGKLVLEATAVSMKHTLVNENRWSQKEYSDSRIDESPFEQAYKHLELFSFD